MKSGVIYKITSPSGRYYIGKTVNLNGRLSSYKNHNNKEQRLIYNSILKYDLNTNLIKEWFMLPSQISKEIKKDSSQLLRTLKDENKKCNGFYWKYKIKQN